MGTPGFNRMGGKVRLRKWLIEHFPEKGRTYTEIFCGVGNVFFLAYEKLDFQNWVLVDNDIAFLQSLKIADLNQLPKTVSREEFEYWTSKTCPIAKILEPRITYSGKGYRNGFNPTEGKHNAYSRKYYKPLCEKAQEILKNAELIHRHWEYYLLDSLNKDDFVYLDPPYYCTKPHYGSINHEKLIQRLNGAPFQWALSGYDSDLYEKNLGYTHKHQKHRDTSIKNGLKGYGDYVRETLWTNY